jgi:hypothetical protein
MDQPFRMRGKSAGLVFLLASLLFATLLEKMPVETAPNSYAG